MELLSYNPYKGPWTSKGTRGGEADATLKGAAAGAA